MTRDSAQGAVSASAFVVAGLYLFRKFIEPATPAASSRGSSGQPSNLRSIPGQLIGQGVLASPGRFVIGWGFVYIVLSLLADAAPKIGGYGAVLVAAGAVLGNGQAVSKDLGDQLDQNKRDAAKASTTASGSSTDPTVLVDYTGGGIASMGVPNSSHVGHHGSTLKSPTSKA